MKANPDKVHPRLAINALELVNGDLNAAYSQYIKLHYRATGSLAPGCDAKDLQAFYNKQKEGAKRYDKSGTVCKNGE